MKGYWFLGLAILAEVLATSALKSSQQFTRLGPSLLVIGGYMVAFWSLSVAIDTIPVGVAYAIWAGLGTVLVALVALVLHRQIPDLPALLGIGLILAGVVVIHGWSRTLQP